MIRLRNDTSLVDAILKYYDTTLQSNNELKIINDCTDTMSSDDNQNLEYAILSNVEIESQQITNMTTENSSNDPHFNHRYTNLDVDLSQPNTIFDEFSKSEEINHQIINLEKNGSNITDHIHRPKSFDNVSSQSEKLLCSSDVQNYQTIYLEKNTSNNTDYIDSLKRFDNISSQPNQKTNAMLPNNNSYQCHQVTNSDRNILDSNYRRTQFDDDFLQPNIPNTTLSKAESRQIINLDGTISGDSDSSHKLKSFNYVLSQPNNFDAILPSGKIQSQPITNLKTNSPIGTDSNYRYKRFESVLSIEDTKPEVNNLNSSNMPKVDKVGQFSLQSLGEAFIDCIYESNNESSNGDYSLNKLLEKSKDKYSPLKEPQNLKRKLEIEDINTNNQIKKLKSLPCSKIYKNKSAEIAPYKNTFGPFLQQNICLRLPPDIDRCVECNITILGNDLTKCDQENVQCRFYAFRELQFSNSGKMFIAGFPDPYKNVSIVDQDLWTPNQYSSTPSSFHIQASIKILEDAGGQLCKLIQDEQEALELNLSEKKDNSKIIWKKNIKGVRELCDVCQTTIFNYHWSCLTCGFVVCVDCIRYKLGRNKPSTESIMFKQDNPIWLICTNRKEHQFDQLNITQILTNDSLNCVSLLMHNICILNNIPLKCNCSSLPIHPPVKSYINTHFPSTFDMFNLKIEYLPSEFNSTRVLSFFDGYVNDDTFENDDDYGFKEDNDWMNKEDNDWMNKKDNDRMNKEDSNKDMKNKNSKENSYYYKEKSVHKLPIIYEPSGNIPHKWLCDGLLLQLLDPDNIANYELFQAQWRRGQPVLVSGVGKHLKKSLWHPESFSRDFGDQTNDLINCCTGKVVSNQPMSKFWDGFENGDKRLHDNNGQSMMLKLKDWPQSEDFAKRLPDRFEDLMNCLPLKEYTQRDGRFNLASRLPECFVRPDLGPKMYIAYGNAGTSHKLLSTTNLHLDMSDAINVMVHVAITKNCYENNHEWYVREAFDVIEESGCDSLTKKRVYLDHEIPGALWHIYHADEADSIRDLLHKIDVEQGVLMEECTDPIHDQTHYLDKYHRERLFKEYGVKGYTIIQCAGDAVFIPAGAPHQVRNLHNCIKVAEDFVSPENIHQSFRMTQEFRNLTDYHTNHEDKLQLKNIVFHAVKDSISVLKSYSKCSLS